MTTNPNTPANEDADAVRTVAPALERYTKTTLSEVWKRPDLSARDRSLVTVAALIARNQAAQLSPYLNRALDNGVKAAELSEVITHLAFYSSWGNATAAAAVAKEVFHTRSIGADQLPPASGPLLPMDEAAESKRAASVEQNVGPVSPGVVQYTSDPLFQDLWRRAALAPRDRSLVTVSALIASGQVAQITFHLSRAMDNGLTKAEASGSAHAPALLRRLAERNVRRAGSDGRVREAPQITYAAVQTRRELRDWSCPRRGRLTPCTERKT